MAVAAAFMLASCGVSTPLTSNANLLQTEVVLSQKNFHVVKNVESVEEATYIFSIGGLSKKALYDNAITELTKKANLTGSQALINVTVKYNVQMILCYTKITAYAEGTVVEFDK
jgi:hypothetical protein